MIRMVLCVADPFKTLGIDRTMDRQVIHQAYRSLARRWHPDRFAEGPERAWAEAKMLEINTAYAECIAQLGGKQVICEERDCLESALAHLNNNQPVHARRVLMSTACRSAEWNYLFGRTLYMLGEYQKAVTYLGVSTRQKPDCKEYRIAYQQAEEQLYGRKNVIRRIFARSV